MNINDLEIKKPYRIIKSKYQFAIGDKIYLYDNNMLVFQEKDEELHKVNLVGGSQGFVTTGKDSGFIHLNEVVTPC